MLSRALSLLSCVTAISLLAPSLQAQQPPFNLSPIGVPESARLHIRHAYDTELPGTGDVTRLVGGRFTGNAIRSVVALDGPRFTILYAPDTIGAWFDAGAANNVNDIALLSSDAGSTDQIVSVGGLGLSVWTYNVTTSKFTSVASAAPAWNGALRIESARRPNGIHVLAGVAANGTTLLIGTTGGTPTSVATGQTIHSIELLDWDGDNHRDEVAAIVGNQLHLYAADGTLITTYLGLHPNGAVVRVPREDGTRDDAGYFLRLPGNNGWWFTLVGGDGLNVPRFALQIDWDDDGTVDDFPIAGLASGDFDNDGDHDIVISSTITRRLTAMENQGIAGNHFSPTIWGPLHYDSSTSPGTPNESAPLAFDATGDGIPDVVGFDEVGDGKAHVFVRPYLDGTVQISGSDFPANDLYGFLLGATKSTLNQDHVDLHLEFDLAPFSLLANELTHLEVFVGAMESIGDGIERDVLTQRFALHPAQFSGSVFVDMDLDQMGILFDLDPQPRRLAFPMVRLIRVDSHSEQVTLASPLYASGYAVRSTVGEQLASIVADLEGLPTLVGDRRAVEDRTAGGKTTVGGLVPVKLIPPIVAPPNFNSLPAGAASSAPTW